MPKFLVDVSRRFVQNEVAVIAVEAKSKAEARKIAKEGLEDGSVSWDASDGEYDHYSVQDVIAAS